MSSESGDNGPAEDPQSIHWRWDDTSAGGSRVALDVDGQGHAVFGPVGGAAFAIRAVRPSGDTAWTYPVSGGTADAASLVAHGGTLYAALYRAHVTGGRVLALDAMTGRPIWEVPLRGLGPLHHSKYANRLQATFVSDRLVVFGDESGGRYVEVLDPADGRVLAHRVEGRR